MRLKIKVGKSKGTSNKGTLPGSPNREPQEYSRNIMEYRDPGRYIPIIFLLYSWGSLFGVPSGVPLSKIVTKVLHGSRDAAGCEMAI